MEPIKYAKNCSENLYKIDDFKTETNDLVLFKKELFSNLKNQLIPPSFYTIDFENALLTFDATIDTDSIKVTYLNYPRFITKTYQFKLDL